MKDNPLKQGIITENSAGVGTVTRKMVRERAVELALINGHPAHEVSKANWEQAKRELTGGGELDSNEALLESAPEDERWDPVHGSTGHQVPMAPNEDEDEDGRNDSTRLVEEGVQEAEHDQMLQAARVSESTDRDEL